MLYELAFVGAYVLETQISLILNFSRYLPKHFLLFLSHFKYKAFSQMLLYRIIYDLLFFGTADRLK